MASAAFFLVSLHCFAPERQPYPMVGFKSEALAIAVIVMSYLVHEPHSFTCNSSGQDPWLSMLCATSVAITGGSVLVLDVLHSGFSYGP